MHAKRGREDKKKHVPNDGSYEISIHFERLTDDQPHNINAMDMYIKVSLPNMYLFIF